MFRWKNEFSFRCAKCKVEIQVEMAYQQIESCVWSAEEKLKVKTVDMGITGVKTVDSADMRAARGIK